MNVWRWLGLSMFLLGAMCLIGTTKFPVHAGGKDKDKDKDGKTAQKDKDKDKDKDKTKDKDKGKDDKGKDKDKDKDKDKGKDKDKDKGAKVEPPKKVEPTVKGDLTFKAFEEGKTFYQKQETDTEQTMKVMGQEVVQKQNQTFIIEWKSKAKDKEGNFVVEQKIVGIKMTINIGGNKIPYDSTLPENKQAKNPMTDFFAQLQKNTLTFTISPKDLTVKNIEGRKEFITGLGNINPQMLSLLNAILSDKALTKMAEPTWYAFPKDGKIPTDKKWERPSELDLGPIGKYHTTFYFTYDGLAGEKDTIGIKTKLEYTAPTEKAGLPFIIHEAKLTADGGTGKAIFDRSKGRFESTEINMTLKGTLKIEVGNMQTTVELDQKQKATSVTSDANPWAK